MPDGASYTARGWRSRPRRRNWCHSDTQKLIKLHEQGLSYNKIAEMMNRPRQTIQDRASRLGLSDQSHLFQWTEERKRRLGELWGTDIKRSELALQVGTTFQDCAVQAQMLGFKPWPKIPIKWTQEMLDRLYALHDEGKVLREIAEDIGISTMQVWYKLRAGPSRAYSEAPRASMKPKPRACIGRVCKTKPREQRMFQPKHRGNFLCETCTQSIQWLA